MKQSSSLAARCLAAAAIVSLAALGGCHNGPHPAPPPAQTDGKDGKDHAPHIHHNGPHTPNGTAPTPTPGPVEMNGPHQ